MGDGEQIHTVTALRTGERPKMHCQEPQRRDVGLRSMIHRLKALLL